MKPRFSKLNLILAVGGAIFTFITSVQGNVGGSKSGIYADFVTLTVNGTSHSYQGTPTDGGAGSSFPVSLGNVASLILTGGEEDVFRVNGGNIKGCTLYYLVGSGSWNSLTLPWVTDNYGGNANNQQWAATGQNVNLLSGLTLGTQTTIHYYWTALANDGGSDFYWSDNNGGANYSMTVTPVPEPITLALPIFGGLVLTAGLSRRFISRRADRVV